MNTDSIKIADSDRRAVIHTYEKEDIIELDFKGNITSFTFEQAIDLCNKLQTVLQAKELIEPVNNIVPNIIKNITTMKQAVQKAKELRLAISSVTSLINLQTDSLDLITVNDPSYELRVKIRTQILNLSVKRRDQAIADLNKVNAFINKLVNT